MKKFLAMLLAVAIATTMSIPAFAADEGEDVATDHSGSETGVSESADIGVYGTYKDTQYADTVLSVDVSWTSMNFRYAVSQQGTWNPETHTYKDSESEPAWLEDTATITLANHSNSGVKASLGYTAIATGVTGTLSKSSVELATAEGTASTNPPSDSVTFKVSGAMSEGETSLGTITVSIEAVVAPVCLDLSSVTSDTEQSVYDTAIAEWLAEIDPDKAGGVTLNVKLPSTAFSKMGNKICDALFEYYNQDVDTKVELVCYGTTTLVESTWYQSGCNVNSIRFPDATTLAYHTFNYLGDQVTSITLDKITKIPNCPFSQCTGLTSIKFCSVITNVYYEGWVDMNASNITLYLNSAQGEATYLYSDTTTPVWGENGSFGKVTFANVVAA